MRAGPEFLFQHLRDCHGLVQLIVDFEPPAPLPNADQHICASALQKAIRRGDIAIARRAGHQLYRLDRPRLWRRLAVTALEDIGIADVAVVVEVMGIALITPSRRIFGSDLHALDIALARACAAVKDRTGDHLASVMGREPVEPSDEIALRTASPNALLAMVASSHLSWKRRLCAALGVAFRSVNDDTVQPVASGMSDLLDVLHELGVPLPLIGACETYAARQRDALPIFVPFAWLSMTASRVDSSVVRHDLPKSELVGEIPEWAFDPLWTRAGKRAVELFTRSHLMKPPYTTRQIAAALWNAESAQCDRTLDWTMTHELRTRAHAADLIACGLPREKHGELNAWIARERPALTAARIAAWKNAVATAEVGQQSSEEGMLPLPIPRKPK